MYPITAPDILLNIGLDKKQGRLKINNNSNYQMTVSGTAKYVCTTLNASLSFKPEFVFRPIRLAVNFELADGIPNSEGNYIKLRHDLSFNSLSSTRILRTMRGRESCRRHKMADEHAVRNRLRRPTMCG